jgi:hypothetical protein
MQLRQSRLRNKETDEDIFGRHDRHDGRSCRHRFTGLREHIRDAAAHRRRDCTLSQPPFGHGHSCPRRLNCCTLRLDLGLTAHRRPRLGKRRFGVLRLGFCRTIVGTPLIDGLRCRISCPQQRFVAL